MNVPVHRQTIVLTILALFLFGGCGEIDADPDSQSIWVAVKEKGFVGYIDNNGARRVSTSFASGKNFSEGYAGVNVGAELQRRGQPLKGKWGFINQKGELEINPVFTPSQNGILPYQKSRYHILLQDSYRFSEGLAAVKQNDKWVYVNDKGEVKITGAKQIESLQTKQYSIQTARTFHEEIAAVRLKSGWGYINRTGELILPAKYAYAYDLRDGYLMTVNWKGELFCFNKKGQEIFTQRRLASPFSNGIAIVKQGFKNTAEVSGFSALELMDRGGRFTTEAQFDYIGKYGEKRSPARVGSSPAGALKNSEHISCRKYEGGMWGFIDSTGKFMINPTMNEAKGFDEGYAPVRIGKRWGYMNPQGQYLFKPQFSFAGPFVGGFARVRIARNHEVHPQRAAWINRAGDIIWTDGTPNR